MIKPLMMGVATGALAILMAGFIALVKNHIDKPQHDSYCELVTMWEADRVRGVDVYDRKGHPNFNQVECE